MKPILSYAVFGLGACVAILAVATSYRYGHWQDPAAVVQVGNLTLNYGIGAMCALLHIAIGIFATAIVLSRRKSRFVSIACVAFCCPLVIVSLWNAVALLALQRSLRGAEARTVVERVGIRRAELETIGARLALVGWKQLATVEAEIAAERHNWIWDATSACKNVTGSGQRPFCARLARLEGERETAHQADASPYSRDRASPRDAASASVT